MHPTGMLSCLFCLQFPVMSLLHINDGYTMVLAIITCMSGLGMLRGWVYSTGGY